MKNKLFILFGSIKEALFSEYLNLGLFLGALLCLLASFLLWRLKLDPAGIQTFQRTQLSPLALTLIIILINALLAVFSHSKDSAISRLILAAGAFVSLLVLILGLFYLINI